MKRILFPLLFVITTTVASAQSFITAGFDGNGLSHTGIRLKYAHNISRLQFAAYGSVATGGLLKVGEQGQTSTNGIAGISLNKVPDTTKGLNIYYGVSVEGLVHDYLAKNSGAHYIDPAILFGPQLGINVFLSERFCFNAEWGIRAGINYGHVFHLGDVIGSTSPSYYARENSVLIYVPTTIGLTYRLGPGKK
ncbi:MAG: hypothetical protein KDC07_05320 [Chitinophagaceae bacterium]|nr:hypothetical protein [Chitinophagaceae bacterium]